MMVVLKDGKENGTWNHDRGSKLVPHLCWAADLKGMIKASAYFRINYNASCQMWTYFLCGMRSRKTP